MTRRTITLFTTALLLLCLTCAFAACGNGSSSSAPADVSASEPAPAPDSSTAAAPATDSTEAPAAAGADIEGIFTQLATAAALGDSTVSLRDLELTSAGVNLDNVVAWKGAESQTAAQNGGIVLVFEVAPGTADALVASLNAYRDAKVSDDRYAEYAEARENTANARIASNDTLVLYAVAADAQPDKVDTAISEILGQ